MAPIAVLYAAEDAHWRDVAVGVLCDFTHALTPLRAGAVIAAGVPVLVIWTAHAAQAPAVARAMLRSSTEVILWRPDGAPPPPWIVDAIPVGPEMPVRTLALMAKFAVAEGERRARAPAPRQRGLGRAALAAGVGGAVTLAMAGAALLYATGDSGRTEVAGPPPLAELRGMQ